MDRLSGQSAHSGNTKLCVWIPRRRQASWHVPVIPALGMETQVPPGLQPASLAQSVISSSVRNPVSKSSMERDQVGTLCQLQASVYPSIKGAGTWIPQGHPLPHTQEDILRYNYVFNIFVTCTYGFLIAKNSVYSTSQLLPLLLHFDCYVTDFSSLQRPHCNCQLYLESLIHQHSRASFHLWLFKMRLTPWVFSGTLFKFYLQNSVTFHFCFITKTKFFVFDFKIPQLRLFTLFCTGDCCSPTGQVVCY